MPFFKIENLSKNYSDFPAVQNVSLEIEAGEIFGLLGASGSGKTAILRMIGGLESPTNGKITLRDIEITNLPPEEREIGTNLQDYRFSLDSTVGENIAQSLKARQFSGDQIAQKITETLNLIGLKDFQSRRVNELSGGQQQLVAIARAIAVEPQLVLLDEPLSNLDAAVREETLRQLKNSAKNLNIAVIYVAQGQEESFAICDRIGVLENGRILQIGTPRDVYAQPETAAVAGFIGRNNLIQATRISSERESLSEFQTVAGEHRLFVDATEKRSFGETDGVITLAIRPENLSLTFGAAFPEDNLIKGVISEVNYLGATTRVMLDAGGLKLEALVLRLIGLKPGDVCLVGLPPNRFNVLKD